MVSYQNKEIRWKGSYQNKKNPWKANKTYTKPIETF
jgi:hypothetical protein